MLQLALPTTSGDDRQEDGDEVGGNIYLLRGHPSVCEEWASVLTKAIAARTNSVAPIDTHQDTAGTSATESLEEARLVRDLREALFLDVSHRLVM